MATAFKQVVHQNLECPVCLSFFKEPKILTCSHTFCKGCLETLLESHQDKRKLSCPVCREETSVPGGDVSRLQTNITVRSLVEDVVTQSQVCANCDPKLAVAYCNECGDYLCESCKDVHSKWARFVDHSVVAVKDVLSGKVSLRRRCKCPKHPTDDEECFCIGCGKYVCFKCGVLEHAQEGHKLMEAVLHENEQKEIIEELTSKAEAKLNDVDKYLTFVTDQRERLQNVRTQLHGDIDEAFEEKVRKLTERKVKLKSDVEQRLKELETSLVEMEATGRQQITQVNAVNELVKNGLKVPLQKEALTAQKTLCQELEDLLGRIDHDEQKPRKTAEEGEQLHFMRSQRSDGIELGEVGRGELKWNLLAEKQLPITDGMHGMAISPKNVMAVCCYKGGVWTYSAEGVLQETVLKHVKVRALHFLSDSTYVIRNSDNKLSLHTPQCEKTNVAFETLGHAEGGFGDLTIDQDGNILTSYWKIKTIQVFKPEGGKTIRTIQCNGFEPHQIFAMNQCKTVVVNSSNNTVRVIDDVSGATIHSITKDNDLAHPAVCKDDSVIIAWVKQDQGLVSIDHYTSDLKHVKQIITDFKLKKPSRYWCYLQQFKTGEIAFCTSDRLYIFRETWPGRVKCADLPRKRKKLFPVLLD